jgi:hypothetical protein
MDPEQLMTEKIARDAFHARELIMAHDQQIQKKPSLHSAEEIEQSKKIREKMKNTVIRYDSPCEPVGVEDWEVLKEDDESK